MAWTPSRKSAARVGAKTRPVGPIEHSLHLEPDRGLLAPVTLDLLLDGLAFESQEKHEAASDTDAAAADSLA